MYKRFDIIPSRVTLHFIRRLLMTATLIFERYIIQRSSFWQDDPFIVHLPNTEFQHGAVHLLKHLIIHLYGVIRSDADDVRIKGGMMDFTQ